MASRRDFLSKTILGTAAITVSGASATAMSAKSYKKIIGANDRLRLSIAGLGRRYGAFIDAISSKDSNVELVYVCDVMEHQRIRALKRFASKLDYKPKAENDIRKVFADDSVDVLINATPDHWHAPGSIIAMQSGKHVYVEKPSSHNMDENEKLVEAAKAYNKVVQMGNQQRSSLHTQEIIKEIHNGVIGEAFKAIAFYTNTRGEVPVQKKAPVPSGLDWDLWQGPAPRREYTDNTWDYNWHWYGWDYGTAEAGNNGTHEIDIARWAMGVNYPSDAMVQAYKRHFKKDGWEMYDTISARFKFQNDRIIEWDCRSRNGYDKYGGDRGTIIYGTEGSVFIDRNTYRLYDLSGKLVKSKTSDSYESGTALGGGGNVSTSHMLNFFNTIRGKDKLHAPIDDANISMAMVHYANMAYRLGKGFSIDEHTGRIYDREAMKLWSRTYEPGWEIKI